VNAARVTGIRRRGIYKAALWLHHPQFCSALQRYIHKQTPHDADAHYVKNN